MEAGCARAALDHGQEHEHHRGRLCFRHLSVTNVVCVYNFFLRFSFRVSFHSGIRTQETSRAESSARRGARALADRTPRPDPAPVPGRGADSREPERSQTRGNE